MIVLIKDELMHKLFQYPHALLILIDKKAKLPSMLILALTLSSS